MSFPSTLSASSLRHFSLTPLSSLGCQGLSLNSLSPTSSFPRLLDAKISKKLRRLPTTNPSTKTSIIATTHPQPQVSIPQWCDCCCHWSHRLRSALLVSIPQWCDCCKATSLLKEAGLRFQSHNGAIAARQPPASGHRRARFQSHNGAIAAL